jgi:plastocyanin
MWVDDERRSLMMRRCRAILVAVGAIAVLLSSQASFAGAEDAATLKGTVSLPPDSGPVKDVVVYLEGAIGVPTPGKAVIDQKDMTFIPHVVPVVAGSSVEFLNSDQILHNVFSTSAPKRFDLGMFGKGESRSVTFDTLGVVQLRCNVHPTMRAVVLVLANNYFATPDDRGNFQISAIPPGRYKLRAWHESLPAVETWVNMNQGTVQTVDLRFQK